MSTLKRYHEAIAQHIKERTQLVDVLCYPAGRSLLDAPVEGSWSSAKSPRERTLEQNNYLFS